MLIFLLSTFTLGIVDSVLVRKDFDYDALTGNVIFLIYLITFGFLWMANRCKAVDDFRMIEIDEIGVKE